MKSPKLNTCSLTQTFSDWFLTIFYSFPWASHTACPTVVNNADELLKRLLHSKQFAISLLGVLLILLFFVCVVFCFISVYYMCCIFRTKQTMLRASVKVVVPLFRPQFESFCVVAFDVCPLLRHLHQLCALHRPILDPLHSSSVAVNLPETVARRLHNVVASHRRHSCSPATAAAAMSSNPYTGTGVPRGG